MKIRDLKAPYLAKPLAFAATIVTVISFSVVGASVIVGTDVVSDTPIVLDGEVLAIDQVGQTIIVGGTFTQVQTERGGPIVDQRGLFAYDAETGAFNDDFRPVLSNGDATLQVTDIEPAPDGQSVFISGDFLRIDDRSDGVTRFRARLAKIDVNTGLLDRDFMVASPSARPRSISYSDGWLYVGGSFLSVADTTTGTRVDHSVRGLARFDADTAAFDPGFNYRSEIDIGPVFNEQREFGVSTLDVTADGTSLVVAHRGAQVRDVTRGSVTNAGGVAIIALGDNPSTHSLRGFQALYPDPDDPVQEFYHGSQCGDFGLQIQDLETSPDSSYFVVVGQGTDAGFQCDTATRFEIGDAPSRPTWVARAFDSLFSVAIGDDAIYIGGHHRFMVGPNAPSPYPGATTSNGEIPEFGEVYFADPTVNSTAARAFRDDLFLPGYVYPVGQLGAIDPDTGYGIPEWTPQSNALVGVLDLTLTDRGLLLGQDGSRVNNITSGRAAVLEGVLPEPVDPPPPPDPVEPPPPEPVICPTDSLEGTRLLAWNGDIDWYRVTIRRNGRWLTAANGRVDFAENPVANSLAQAARTLRFRDVEDTECRIPTIDDGRLLLIAR